MLGVVLRPSTDRTTQHNYDCLSRWRVGILKTLSVYNALNAVNLSVFARKL